MDVSKGSSTYTPPATSANWQFAQFNNFVIAVQQNTPPQVFDLRSSSNFSDLSGDANMPQASYVSVVNRFLVLSGIATTAYRVQWSGLNDLTSSTSWSSGVNQSDFQDLADGGLVKGSAGGEFGVIFQDRSIRRMLYQPGSPLIFGIERISSDDGLFAPGSLVSAGDRIFFCSIQGFKMIQAGGFPTPIGKEKVDRTFFADVDTANLQLMIGASDPRTTRVYWAYKSAATSALNFDKILCYDWALDRWTQLNVGGEFLALMAQPGLTLEGVDVAYCQNGASTTINSITSANPAVFQVSSLAIPAVHSGLLLTGTLPSGLSSNVPYYVRAASLTASTFTVSISGGIGAYEGSAVATTNSVGSTARLTISSIDSITSPPSLDGISNASLPQLGAVDSNHKLGFFAGQTLEAVLVTPEHGGDGKRIHVDGFRPVTDATSCMGSLIVRDNEQNNVTSTSEVTIDAKGFVYQRRSTRYARAKVRIPAGTNWTFGSGVEPAVKVEGTR